ncbi:hypothetical protein JOL62DRAFT_226911 [Phyllosticta paracitricarpa]|uniref:Uncharacterized protein n=1 Tax=Phyllosticta paracitricarpa TaxID=2016321 RepID=A0ABR1NI73_9PEZI
MLRKRRKPFHKSARLVEVRLHDIDRVSNSWLTLGPCSLQLHLRATGFHRERASRSRYVRSNRLIGTPRRFTCERAEPKADNVSVYSGRGVGRWKTGSWSRRCGALGWHVRDRQTSLEHEELAAPSHARQDARAVAARQRILSAVRNHDTASHCGTIAGPCRLPTGYVDLSPVKLVDPLLSKAAAWCTVLPPVGEGTRRPRKRVRAVCQGHSFG